MNIAHKKSVIIFLATLIIFINVAPAFAWVWALRLVGFGTKSVWQAGGSRVLSACVKAIPSGGTGVLPAIRTAWIAVTKNKTQLAQLAAGALAAGGAAAGFATAKNNWNVLAQSISEAKNWILENGEWKQVVSGSGDYVLSDTRAYDYFFNTLLISFSNHQPPNINNNMGVYETDGLASAAADAKRTALLADSTYSSVSTKTSGLYNLVAAGVYDNTAKFKAYQVGAYNTAAVRWEWWYYSTGYAGGATAVPAGTQTRTLEKEDVAEAVAGELANDNTQAQDVVSEVEKALNDMMATGAAEMTAGWCGSGKTIKDCVEEWFNTDLSEDAINDVVENGEETVTEETETPSGNVEATDSNIAKIKARFIEFVDNLKASSIGSLYDNMFGNIPTSSECEITVNMGATFGGTHTVSFCRWGSWFSTIAAVLLLVAGFAAFKIIVGGKS